MVTAQIYFITERYEEGQCKINGKPIGIVSTLGYGLDFMGVGIGRHIPINVTEILSYWMNVLMTCAPSDPNGACPTTTGGGSFYELYENYGRNDHTICKYNPYYVDAYVDEVGTSDFVKMIVISIVSASGICIILSVVLLRFVKRNGLEGFEED